MIIAVMVVVWPKCHRLNQGYRGCREIGASTCDSLSRYPWLRAGIPTRDRMHWARERGRRVNAVTGCVWDSERLVAMAKDWRVNFIDVPLRETCSPIAPCRALPA